MKNDFLDRNAIGDKLIDKLKEAKEKRQDKKEAKKNKTKEGILEELKSKGLVGTYFDKLGDLYLGEDRLTKEQRKAKRAARKAARKAKKQKGIPLTDEELAMEELDNQQALEDGDVAAGDTGENTNTKTILIVGGVIVGVGLLALIIYKATKK